MFLKFFFIIYVLLYQTHVFSKSNDNIEFNHRYLSNYLSALLSNDSQDYKKSLNFFNSSKSLINKHDNFLKEYVFSLVDNYQTDKAIKLIKNHKDSKNTNFFEAKLLLILDLIKKEKFTLADNILDDFKISEQNDTYELIIYETLKSYNNLFVDQKIKKTEQNFGKLSLITSAFQNCYLNSDTTNSQFINIINSEDADYSRYLYFYLENALRDKNFDISNEISLNIDSLSGSLLVSQVNKWIQENQYSKFGKYFSCQKETDLLGEFFFLIANLYSSQDVFEKSNFYLKISNFLNPKFYFNLTLLAENYYINENYEIAQSVLEKLDNEEEIYNWYKIKKIGQIISKQQNNKKSLDFIEREFNKIYNPSPKILFDIANIYKSFKKYKKAIEYYSKVLKKIDQNSEVYADVLYRRGGSFERVGNYEKSDKDLLESLKINPEEPYVLNYLAYSWLERNYKINEAIDMLGRAYEQKKNDPYIIDSVGWGYYLIGDYETAEKYLKKALLIMPDDPIVNDHYADVLWKLNKKIQAKYFWESVLNLDSADEEMKNKIFKKLLKGPDQV